MIRVNDIPVEISHFPDNTLLMHVRNDLIAHSRYPSKNKFSYMPEDSITNMDAMRGHKRNIRSDIEIQWYFENNEELVTLSFLVQHLREHGYQDLSLFMPYIPNARQDRAKNDFDVLTLKYFANIINSMNFSLVCVADPHSSVSENLINNLCILTMKNYMELLVFDLSPDLLFYPDEGAAKRYGSMLKHPYAYGIKNRDWETGKIMGLEVMDNNQPIRGKNILIIDDICSKGGTFYYSAKKLKELGANEINLYITHCENSILEGDLIDSGLLTRIYTTDSLFTKYHPLIHVHPIKNLNI